MKRGWHAAYCISPICESLLPGWDVTYPVRAVRVSAPGYATADSEVGIFTHYESNEITGELAGAYLKVAQLKLHPLIGPAANNAIPLKPR